MVEGTWRPGDNQFDDDDEHDDDDLLAPPARKPFPEPGLPESPRSLAGLVQVVLALVFVAGVARLAAEVDRLNLIRAALADLDEDLLTRAVRSDAWVLVTTVVWSSLFLLVAVAFVLWFHRVRANAGIWSPLTMRLRRGWAIWGWLCPVINLWFPYLIAQDCIEATRTPYTAEPTGRGLVRVWWASWVLTLLAGLIAVAEGGDRTLGRDVLLAAWVAVGATAVGLASAVLAFLVVRTVTTQQLERLTVATWEVPLTA